MNTSFSCATCVVFLPVHKTEQLVCPNNPIASKKQKYVLCINIKCPDIDVLLVARPVLSEASR